jgi:hypothetical protein
VNFAQGFEGMGTLINVSVVASASLREARPPSQPPRKPVTAASLLRDSGAQVVPLSMENTINCSITGGRPDPAFGTFSPGFLIVVGYQVVRHRFTRGHRTRKYTHRIAVRGKP